MGQHKTNPTAKLAKEGKLEPKKRGPSKAEVERQIKRHIWQKFFGDKIFKGGGYG